MSEFNLKSGNATPFKLMGSSPAKLDEKSREYTKKGKSKGQTGYEHSRKSKGFKSKKGVEAYTRTLSGINKNMSKSEVISYVRASNKGKSATDASRMGVNSAIRSWRGSQRVGTISSDKSKDVKETTTKPIVTKTKPTVTKPTQEKTKTPKRQPQGWAVESGGLTVGVGKKFKGKLSKQKQTEFEGRELKTYKGL